MLKFHAAHSAADRAAALTVYQSNPAFFTQLKQQQPTALTVREDAEAYPDDVSETQKHYGLLLVNGDPIGVLDRLNGYPEPSTVYIGLLMIRKDRQRQGLGRRTIDGLAKQFRRQGYTKLRVAVAADNPAGLAFWQQIGFTPVGEGHAEAAVPVVILDRDLAD
ncbi:MULTISPECIES: GNAT family N-acetyltransferase [unclassified Lacticaseibacillus]|uniref:GNAT family N-acetyltransferase n=1 Tax=unclassified Lacticaseibacillus TaxID=2759744 RepID=UPI001943DA19|nr:MULTISPECIES: GNAT family N-acetyltransferase [unclassified Lacticaseibacillus]